MKDKTQNPTKRRKLWYWLSAAAFLLIVAAITLGLIFGLRGNRQTLSADNFQQGSEVPPPPAEDNKPEEEDKPSGGEQNTSSQYEFIAPIKDVSLIKSHEFNWDKTMSWYCLHQAMDFGAPVGTEVMAAVDGKIVSVVTSDMLDYAVIEIEHANNLTTVYKFIDPVEDLRAGQEVSRGQVIGRIASASGVEHEDGDHLHFEVWKAGEPVDPDEYLNLISK